MTAPQAGSGRDDATVRGAIVLVVAIVIGLALLARSGGGGDDSAATTTSSTTEATASTDSTPPTDSAPTSDTLGVPADPSETTASVPGDTVAPAELLVVVLNATEEVGWASENATTLASAGYQTDSGNVKGENVDVSAIYATPEAQGNVEQVRSLLGLSGAPVAQKPADPMGRNSEDAEAGIVVVLGADSVG